MHEATIDDGSTQVAIMQLRIQKISLLTQGRSLWWIIE